MARSRILPRSWFEEDAVALAPRLLGKVVRFNGCAGRIVETEAYMTDPASHAFKITKRSALMQETYGHWYVYFTYGMHHCLNVTTGNNSTGAVLIRALEPLEGIPEMELRRGTDKVLNLCSGPAKLCQALGISIKENGLPLSTNFGICDAPEVPRDEILTSPRIGISKATELPWRFYIRDNRFISR